MNRDTERVPGAIRPAKLAASTGRATAWRISPPEFGTGRGRGSPVVAGRVTGTDSSRGVRCHQLRTWALAGSVGAGVRLLFIAALAAGSILALARALIRGRLPLVAFRFCFAALLGAVPVRVAALRLHPAVVAPTDEDLQRVDPLAHEEAQPHGRGEEALLRGPAVFGGVVAEPRPFRDLGLVVHVRVAALLDRRATGDEKSGEIPVGRPLPAPQSLVRQRMAGPRTDEVEPERAGDLLADLGGLGRASHVTVTMSADLSRGVDCLNMALGAIGKNRVVGGEERSTPSTGGGDDEAISGGRHGSCPAAARCRSLSPARWASGRCRAPGIPPVSRPPAPLLAAGGPSRPGGQFPRA